MSPLFGRSKGDAARAFDPALDDAQLAAARDALIRGRWEEARTLLSVTGTDWDRRSHRVAVLADAVVDAPWDEDWLSAEPHGADANALHAYTLALRLGKVKGDPRDAVLDIVDACELTATLDPDDPVPWLARLLLAARTVDSSQIYEHFDEVRKRAPYHRDGYHAMLDCLIASRPRTPGRENVITDAFRFADWAAESAPAGSPLAVLPLVAHAAQFGLLAGDSSNVGLHLHWVSMRANWSIDQALDRWWRPRGRQREHPRALLDLNVLAHAMAQAGRAAEAGELFDAIGQYPTRYPWDLGGKDPVNAFQYARSRALGEASP
jgi:hypothetical protein